MPSVLDSPSLSKEPMSFQRLQVGAHFLYQIEPADADGLPNAFFRKLIQDRTTSGGAYLSGRIYARPPRSSILGRGNFCKVWRGRNLDTGQLYAVKNLDSRSSQRECDVMLRLSAIEHPYIVTVLCIHHFHDVPLACAVLNLCTGGDLSAKIKSHQLEAEIYEHPPETSKWTMQIMLGIEYLHCRVGIIHMDIKPANILIDSEGCSQLADFGLSSYVDDTRTPRETRGTPGYVAPEVLRREQYDWRADIYSAGAVLWVLMRGGTREQLEPAPPNSAHLMLTYNDTDALCGDWLLLYAASESALATENNDVRSAMKLVIELTAKSPDARPSHEDILASPFLTYKR